MSTNECDGNCDCNCNEPVEIEECCPDGCDDVCEVRKLWG